MPLCNGLKFFDVFGASVGLTHQGNTKYRTRLGGLTVVLIILIMTGLTIDGVTNIFDGNSATQSISNTY